MDSHDDQSDRPSREQADYEVGYGRPPVHSRFRAGQSGNHRGRPIGSQSHSTIVRRVALRRVATGAGASQKRNIDLVLDVVRRAAAKGDVIALSLVKKYTGVVEDDEPPIAKGVLIAGEKLTEEEFEEKYRHLREPDAGETEDRPSDGTPSGPSNCSS